MPDLLSDNSQHWMQGVILLMAFVTAVTVFWKKILKPAWKGLKTIVKAAKTILEHNTAEHLETLDNTIEEVRNAISPTNGDKSTISARVDKTAHEVKHITDAVHIVKDRLYELDKKAQEQKERSDALDRGQKTILQRQGEHRDLTVLIARAANEHNEHDSDNFRALAVWSENFTQFPKLEVKEDYAGIPIAEIERMEDDRRHEE